MKKLLLLGSFVALVASCNKGSGELVGVLGRPEWFQPDPFGMLFCKMGSFNMGPSDEDASWSHTTRAKTVSVQAFFIDQTEITNNEYRQFVEWVKDSIARRLLIDNDIEGYAIEEEEYFANNPLLVGEEFPDPPPILREKRVEWYSVDEDYRTAINSLYLEPAERFYKRKEIDTRKLNYEYYWIDLKNAAKKSNRFIPQKSQDKNGQNFINGVGTTAVGDNKTLGSYTVNGKTGLDRSVFIIKDVINVYPDTLAWVHDFTYSFNEPMTNNYFWHPAYDDYPVVGVTWKQCKAFCIWRTELLNEFRFSFGEDFVNHFRLPTEAEWEYAARGGLALSPYPWGGPYIRNARGCFLGNFKPMRGSYIDDGGFHTVKVFSYNPNEFGLYCMAGNVAEWTSNAYDESMYDFDHDLNPNYEYDAKDEEPSVMKRKVIRGGSWKDVGFYLQTSSRTYEYQDTAKCYIGFRCVMTYLGRDKDDNL